MPVEPARASFVTARTGAPTIRREERADFDEVEMMVRRAFPGPEEAALVREIRGTHERIISLVAESDERLAGHIMFTPVGIGDDPGERGPIALGPMAVDPPLQRQGIGSALVEGGLAACRDAGETLVFVLGHAGYYPRFGFRPAADAGYHYRSRDLDPHFMMLELAPGAGSGRGGWIRYLPAFEVA